MWQIKPAQLAFRCITYLQTASKGECPSLAEKGGEMSVGELSVGELSTGMSGSRHSCSNTSAYGAYVVNVYLYLPTI